MSRNSVTGRFRDIEISFSIDGPRTIMGVRNLLNDERQVSVMYQKLAVSGLANWKQFQLNHTPLSFRLPMEVLEAYRLTFFVDKADPISARVEKILEELETLRTALPESYNDDVEEYIASEPEIAATKQVEEVAAPNIPEQMPEVVATEQVDEVEVPDVSETLFPESELLTALESEQKLEEKSTSVREISPLENHSDNEDRTIPEPETAATQQVEQVVIPDVPEQAAEEIPDVLETLFPESESSTASESEQKSEEESIPMPTIPKVPAVQDVKPMLGSVDANLEFKITVPSLPASALAEQRKLQMAATGGHASANARSAVSKRRKQGIFGQLTETLGLAAVGRRGKAYYQEQGEAIQNNFQDQLAKLERDYNEGYGISLADWDPEMLCEEEIAVLLLNLMVSEMKAWQKEVGRATPETKELAQALAEIDKRLRLTLKQTRGISTPSPTLFPDFLAESQRDLEKIQSECDAYLQRFSSKLAEQEKKHAEKIEVVIFKKFLIEFIRDFLFVEIAKSTAGEECPKRLSWFLDLVDSEIIPIEAGKTKVSPNHHKVKGVRASEFESGTIIEVITQGLQSKDGRRVSHTAVVIEAE